MPLRIFEHQLQALREAFMAMLPFVLFSVSALLISQLLALQPWWAVAPLQSQIQILASVLIQSFPLVLTISISLHSANMFGISRPLAIASTLLVLFASEGLFLNAPSQDFKLADIAPINALLSALITVHFLRWSFVRHRIDSRYMLMSGEALSIFRFLGPTMLASSLALCSTLFLHWSFNHLSVWINFDLSGLPTMLVIWFKTLISHLFWLIGIHGDHMYRMLFDYSIVHQQYASNFSYKNFYDTFVIFGGSGATLSLVIALLLTKQSKRYKKLALVAAPFSLFNISEVLIYGLPIVFNRYLIIPFLAVPSTNIALSYLFIPVLDISFTAHEIPWITPIFINAYISTAGNFLALLLQLGLLVLGVLIYWPFLQILTRKTQAPPEVLDFYKKMNMVDHLQNHEHLMFWRNHITQEANRAQVYETFELIYNNHLELYFQPIVNPKTGTCIKLECLIRLKSKHGFIPPNQLLDALESTQLATTVDFWVAQQISLKLREMPLPSGLAIAVNIHPSTLVLDPAVNHMIDNLQGLPVELEILERGLPNRQALYTNIQRFRQAGFNVGIDDFGVGYSNLAMLKDNNVDYIKLDKSLIQGATASTKGQLLFMHTTKLIQQLGYVLLIEGVETEQHKLLALEANADLVQGWYYSPALPWDEAIKYAQKSTQGKGLPR